MGALEIIGIIIAVGFVSMIEICAIIGAVNRMVDQKMKTRVELELKMFHAEMEYLDKAIDKLIAGIESCVNGNKKIT